MSALGAGLCSMGIPKNSIVKYESALTLRKPESGWLKREGNGINDVESPT